jgi:fatty-acid desaturase
MANKLNWIELDKLTFEQKRQVYEDYAKQLEPKKVYRKVTHFDYANEFGTMLVTFCVYALACLIITIIPSLALRELMIFFAAIFVYAMLIHDMSTKTYEQEVGYVK